MSTCREHYEELLADHYSWMVGSPVQVKIAEETALLTSLKVAHGELAVDLGAGPGFQSMALADLGFKRVLAFDASAKLLEELRMNCADRPVETIQDDIMRLSAHIQPDTADAIVCMGDTLTHLPTRECVPLMFGQVFRALQQGGKFVLSFRDLTSELSGTERFIPVRSTANKIMTCFLDYSANGVVMVHDLIHLHENGTWKLLKSCYPKLRLAEAQIRRELEQTGFTVYAQTRHRGMCVFASSKD